MRAPLVIAGVVLTVAICACDTAGPAEDDSTSTSVQPPGSFSPAPDDTPRNDLTDTHALDWTSFEVVSENQIRVHYVTGDPTCFGVDSAVEEDESTIRIEVVEGTLPEAPEACTLVGRQGSLLITVDSPVGDREITQR